LSVGLQKAGIIGGRQQYPPIAKCSIGAASPEYFNGRDENHALVSGKNMSNHTTTLFLFSGKIAAGKSTLANSLAAQRSTVLISQDHWLSKLFPDEISTLDDYVSCSARLRDAIGPHVVSLLQEGLSVVMDFPANTRQQRQWLREIFEAADVHHELHFIDVPNDVCKNRLRDRNKSGRHAFQPSEADFDLFTRFFVPPTDVEGFNITIHQT
jgi:predicted kinase